jgi:hypothetical protein
MSLTSLYNATAQIQTLSNCLDGNGNLIPTWTNQTVLPTRHNRKKFENTTADGKFEVIYFELFFFDATFNSGEEGTRLIASDDGFTYEVISVDPMDNSTGLIFYQVTCRKIE